MRNKENHVFNCTFPSVVRHMRQTYGSAAAAADEECVSDNGRTQQPPQGSKTSRPRWRLPWQRQARNNAAATATTTAAAAAAAAAAAVAVGVGNNPPRAVVADASDVAVLLLAPCHSFPGPSWLHSRQVTRRLLTSFMTSSPSPTSLPHSRQVTPGF